MLTIPDVICIPVDDVYKILEKCTSDEVKILIDMIATEQGDRNTEDIARLDGGYTDSIEQIAEVTKLSKDVVLNSLESLSQKGYLIYVRDIERAGIVRVYPIYQDEELGNGGKEEAIEEAESVLVLPLSEFQYSQIQILAGILGKQRRPANDSVEHSMHLASLRKKRISINSSCDICSMDGNLVLHHVDYVNWGQESLNDLTLLCNRCHSKVHSLAKYI